MEQCERRGKAATKRRRTGMTEYNADGKRREQHAACRPMPSTTWQYSPGQPVGADGNQLLWCSRLVQV